MRRVICCFGGTNVAQTSRQQAPLGTTNEQRENSGSNVNAIPSESSQQAPLRTVNEQEESSGFTYESSSNANALPLESAPSETIKVQGESSGLNANVLPKNCGHSFSWSEIVSGTQDLQRTNLLGQGDFGDVFSCEFSNMVGAVKIQKSGSQLAHSEFVAEVKALNAADHPNVIKLLGKCNELRHRAIVYELMPNRSLDRYILAPLRPGPSPLPVNTRMRIAVGVAQGLVYVHRSLKMVHRDIKAGNVLLDNDFEPKLTDFGLAVDVVIGENGGESQNTIAPIKGTHGWVAPETLRNGYVSTKSDVYSYGVLLIHLFTGRKPCDEDRSILVRNLADWFSKRAYGRENYERKIVDASLSDMYSVQGLRKILAIARMCIHEETHVRPTMNIVLPMVREASTHQPHQNSPVTERIF